MNLQRLVKDLIDLGMTQDQIGKEIGRSQAVVSDMKRGKSKRPPYETVRALERVHAEKMKAARAAQ